MRGFEIWRLRIFPELLKLYCLANANGIFHKRPSMVTIVLELVSFL